MTYRLLTVLFSSLLTGTLALAQPAGGLDASPAQRQTLQPEPLLRVMQGVVAMLRPTPPAPWVSVAWVRVW